MGLSLPAKETSRIAGSEEPAEVGGKKEKEWRPLDWTSPAQAPQERIFAPFAPALSTSLPLPP